jgi:O-acetyl-ADP-ribose deacetylase (regulator of RNase III)
MTIRYVLGDATQPHGHDLKVITHVVNDVNRWGAGFALALSQRWPKLKSAYHAWFLEDPLPSLGDVKIVSITTDIIVANILGQHGIRRAGNDTPIRYDALAKGFSTLSQIVQNLHPASGTIHAPRLGCGLAGGRWAEVEPLLQKHFVDVGIPVTIYDLPEP